MIYVVVISYFNCIIKELKAIEYKDVINKLRILKQK